MELANVSDLKVLSSVSHEQLFYFPPQVACCRIEGLPEDDGSWTVDAFLRLGQELLTKGTRVKVRVDKKFDSQYFCGELRLLSNGLSVSKLMTENQESLWIVPTPSKAEIPSSGGEVYITDCQDPGNIKGFPAAYFDQLCSLMLKIQEFYKRNDMAALIPPLSSLQPGQLCAARHSDGQWYRARIFKILNRNVVSVQVPDFGRFQVISSVSDLRCLPSAFFQLPLLSFDMAVAGVVHQYATWSEENTEELKKVIWGKTFRMFVPKATSGLSPLPVTLVNPHVCDNPFVHQILVKQKLVTLQRSDPV